MLIRHFSLSVIALALAACGTTTPECHDPEVKTMVSKLFADVVTQQYKDPTEQANAKAVFNKAYTATVDIAELRSYDDKTGRRSCKAELTLQPTPELSEFLKGIDKQNHPVVHETIAGLLHLLGTKFIQENPNVSLDEQTLQGYIMAGNQAALAQMFSNSGGAMAFPMSMTMTLKHERLSKREKIALVMSDAVEIQKGNQGQLSLQSVQQIDEVVADYKNHFRPKSTVEYTVSLADVEGKKQVYVHSEFDTELTSNVAALLDTPFPAYLSGKQLQPPAEPWFGEP